MVLDGRVYEVIGKGSEMRYRRKGFDKWPCGTVLLSKTSPLQCDLRLRFVSHPARCCLTCLPLPGSQPPDQILVLDLSVWSERSRFSLLRD